MASSAFNGANRRKKALIFLVSCVVVALIPYCLDPKYRVLISLILSVFLGSYALIIILRYKDTKINEFNINKISPEDFLSYPSVDVVVSARDEENVIGQLVEKLQTIEYPKDKLKTVIVDDGSKDQTPILLKDLAEQYPDLIVINRSRNSGGGKSGALNHALKFLNSEWIFILDADAKFEASILLEVLPVVLHKGWLAVQLRKAVINSKKNLLTRCQGMEMAMDAVIQEGRLISGGVVELRGNGQLLKRSALDECGGFNEETVTDDLDLSFRFLLSNTPVGILWNPPIQEEAVESFNALWNQRKRWTEGGLQRFFDYWQHLISNKLTLTKRLDLGTFFLLQYALPIISLLDLILSILFRAQPNFWPLSLTAFSISGLAIFRGCNTRSQGPDIPRPRLFSLIISTVYLAHWFVVIPWITFRMSFFPKNLVWLKTSHSGN